MVKVTLDADTFKALASPTRLSVMRCLGERRKTVTELARDLDMNKATIHEHLQLLTAAGLVNKHDEGRKWIYYALTWRGEKILHPQETTTFNLLLGLAVLAGGGGVAVLGKALQWWWVENAPAEDPGEGPGASTIAMDQQAADEADQLRTDPAADEGGDTFWDEDGILSVSLLALSILTTVLAGLLWKRLRPAKAIPSAGGDGE